MKNIQLRQKYKKISKIKTANTCYLMNIIDHSIDC